MGGHGSKSESENSSMDDWNLAHVPVHRAGRRSMETAMLRKPASSLGQSEKNKNLWDTHIEREQLKNAFSTENMLNKLSVRT